jgi:hypothetical protein
VKFSQTFRNQIDSKKVFNYTFFLPDKANATSLRCLKDNIWKETLIAASHQDKTLLGKREEIDPSLKNYLGGTLLFYNIPDSLDIYA